MHEIGTVVIWIYVLVNVVVFIMYGADKLKAKSDRWRTPESTLLTAALFGIIGALLGMLVFRHKTRKPRFSVGLPIIFFIELIIFLWIKVIYYK